MSIKKEIIDAAKRVECLKKNLFLIGKGKKAQIIKGCRDQLCGKSKPNLKGKIFDVEGVSADSKRIFLRLKGLKYSVELCDVRFMKDET